MSYTIPAYKVALVRDGSVKVHSMARMSDADRAAEVFTASLRGLPHEEMHALYLDSGNRIIGLQVVARGGSAGLSLHPADLLRGAIAANARAMIIAHNHPSGDPTPSSDDLRATRSLMNAGEVVGIALLDHLVVCPEAGTWRAIREIL